MKVTFRIRIPLDILGVAGTCAKNSNVQVSCDKGMQLSLVDLLREPNDQLIMGR